MENLIINKDIEVNYLEKSYKHYLNKTVVLFGATNSGKSTILLEILWLLKKYIPLIFVFSPTAENNDTFEGVAPQPVIYTTVNMAVVKNIYKRQKAATKTFNVVNNIKRLKVLFSRVASPDQLRIADLAFTNAGRYIQSKRDDSSINFSKKKHIIKKIQFTRDEYLRKLYKLVIRTNKKRLLNMGVSGGDKYIIKYLDFNPNCIIVLDDCNAVLKNFQKEEVIKEILFQGRHSYITLILTLQDDLNLDSAIKKNVFVNIFTTGRCASAYFERKSNSFSKKERAKAQAIITELFAPSVDVNYRKLVYLKDSPTPFQFTIADIYDEFKFGSPSMWEMCNKISKNKKRCDFDNDPLLHAFKLDM